MSMLLNFLEISVSIRILKANVIIQCQHNRLRIHRRSIIRVRIHAKICFINAKLYETSVLSIIYKK